MALKDERSIGVNIAAHFDEGSLLNATRRIASMVEVLKQEMNSSDFHNYYKDVDALAKAVENAYRAFEGNRSQDSALNLVKAFNALAALDKSRLSNLSDLMPDLSGAVSSAKDLAGALANAFREENFREAFAAFDSIKENGGDVIKLFERVGQSAETTAGLRREVDRLGEAYGEAVAKADELRERVRELEDDSGVGALTNQLKEAEGELSRLRLTAVEEFKTYLRSNDISPFQTDKFGDRVFSKYFDQIRDGSMTAKQAIASVKSEFASLFDDRSSGVGSEALGTISVRLDDILRKYEELSAQIREAGAAAPMERIGEAAEAGSDAIERQGERIREVASQRSAINDLNDLISMLVSVSTQAEGSTSSLYEQIIPMLEAIREFDTIDPSKLQSIGKIFDGLSGINGFKISSAQAKNLREFLDSVSTMGDISALRSISGVNLKGFSDLSINATSLKNLATYLPTIASVNVENLERLQHIDLSNFASLKIPKIDTEAISGLGKLGDAMVAVKDAAVAMTGMLENAGKTAVQSGRKITDVLSQGAISGSARMVGINKTLSREEYLRGLIGRAEAAGFNSTNSEYIGDYNAVSYLADQYNKLREAIDKGTISQKEYNEKYKELEAATSRESGRLNAAVSEYEKNKKITEMERAAIEAATRQREAKAGWTDAEVADAGIKQQEEYIANLQRIEEETARLQDASWRNEIDDYDAEEDARLAEEIGAKREERERQLQKMQAESLQIAEQRRLEEEKQAETAEKAELRRAEAAVKADEAEHKRAEAAVEAERKAAEEITKLKALRIDYQDQIDRAGELGIDNDTVNGLRSQVSEIDRTIQELERVASGQNGMTSGMDAYKDSVKRARDELVLLKKQLSSDIKTTGAFVPMNDNQVGTAIRDIGTRRTELQQQIDRATGLGLGNTDAVDTLRNLIPLYGRLEERVKDGSISQKDYNEQLRLLASIARGANTELAPEIKTMSELDTQYQKLAESMRRTQDDARNGVSGAWVEATDEQKSSLDNLIARQNALGEAWKNGTLTSEQLGNEVRQITEEYNNLTDAVNREYQARNKAHKYTMDEMNARISLNQEIGNATKLLRDYSAAEHSKNESSRDAYKAIQNSINGMNELGARFDRHEIDLKTLQEEERKYSNEIKYNSSVIRLNGDDHMTAFGKIGRAIKTHLTTLTATLSIRYIMRYIRRMVEAVREIDTAMTELRKVTDETDARYERFLDNAATRAKNLSATISDTVSATADFARLGLSIDEAEKAADAAIVYKAVGDDIASIGDAAESIISTMKAFGVEASDAMSIVDKFNKVGNEFAIGSSGVGEALKRSASAMYAANNTLEETIGLATAANTILQNPQSVGTTLKTVSMYVRAAKTELEEAGEDTEGIAESTGKLRELIKQITAEGGKAVDIMADEDTFKSTYQILEEISEVWDKISDTNQAALMEKLGGKRNANAVSAILENFDIAREAMEAATNAEGSAMAELAKYQESIEGHIVALKTAFQELSQTVIGSDLVKFVVDFGTTTLGAATAIGKLFNALGGFRTALLGLTPILIKSLLPALDRLSEKHNLARGLIRGIVSPIRSAVTMWKAYARGIVDIGAAMEASLGVISLAITAISAAYSAAKQAERNRRNEAIESGKTAQSEAAEILELYNKYVELNVKVKEDASVKDDLNDATTDLLKKLKLEKSDVDNLAKSYDNVSDSMKRAASQAALNELYKKRNDIISGLDTERKDYLESQNPDFITIIKDELATAIHDIFHDPSDRRLGSANFIPLNKDLLTDADYEVLREIELAGLADVEYRKIFEGQSNVSLNADDNLKTMEGLEDAYKRLGEILTKINSKNGTSEELYNAINYFYQELSNNGALDNINSTTKSLAELDVQIAAIEQDIAMGGKLPETIEEFGEYRAALIASAMAGRDVGVSAKEIEDAVDSFLSNGSQFAKFFEAGTNAASEPGSIFNPKTIAEVVDETETLFKLFETAQKEMDEDGYLSSGTIKDIVAAMEDYTKYLTIENGLVKLNADAWKEYASSGIRDNIVATKDEIIRLQEARTEAEAKLAAARNAGVASARVASAVAGLAGTPEYSAEAGQYGKQIAEKAKRQVKESEEAIASYDEQIQKLNSDLELNKAIYKDITGESSAAFDGTADEITRLEGEIDRITSRNEELREILDDIEYHEDAVAGANEKLKSATETVFGNIDTNNRQVLEWTQDNLDQYREALESWGYTTGEIEELAGSISTVLGTSEWYQTAENGNGVEIAFSPILQTENGPVLLSSDTVREYIASLIEKMNAIPGSTINDLLYFDTLGLQRDGIIIRNLLASIGDDAIRVGEAMHFTGPDGAVMSSYAALKKHADRLGISVEDLMANFELYHDELEQGERTTADYRQKVEDLKSSIDGLSSELNITQEINKYKEKVSILTGAWEEFNANGQITTEIYKELVKQFGESAGLVEIVNGKLSLNASAVEKLNEKLRDEYGLKVALAGASDEEIAYVDSLAGAMQNLSETVEDPTSDLKELTGVLADMNRGVELSTFDMLDLIQKYPQLRDKVIATANGYKIEESAIRDLIQAKSQLLTLNERELGITSARSALVTRTGGEQTAAKIDKIFATFKEANGKAITTVEEFAEGYLAEFGSAYENVFAEYEAYVNAMIDLNNGLAVDASRIEEILNDLNNVGVKEGYDPDKAEKETSSSSTKEETAFEKAYKLHQHYLAMDQETEEQYLSWLEGAYKASYAAGEMELDDYYKYEEEVYEKRKALFSQSLDEMQHQIDLLSNQTGDTSAEQIALYEQMQKKVHAKANEYRAMGISDNDELIRELQNQWWQYEENIRQLRENAFSDWLNDKKFLIDQLKQDGASSDEIVNSWKDVLKRINDEIAYYMSKGHDITSDVIQNLMGELKDAKDSIMEALDELVAKANEVVDGFQNVYTTLTNAAKEYASTGYLSVDSLQSILELGPKYMDMLYDESGQLTINEEALQKVIAARTEEMAAETALSYAKQVLLATEGNESQKLKELTDVQAASSSATWDMAYATLGYAKALGATKGISDEYYEKAIQYVTRMQSVTKTATDSISAYYKTLDEGYVSQADGLQTILKLTEDMIKQENSDRIKQLEDEKDAYKDIIEQKKEILRLTKEQNDHDRDMADKLKEISDLQSKIDQLALDDSREARAQRSKLEEQLLEKQKALTDSQNDYAYDAQVDALDKQYDEYEKELNKEADALKDELNSAEKLYRAAIDRISNGWDTLYQDLLNWNYNYGNTLEKDLTKAWDAAKAAAERYGDFVSAMEGVNQHDKLGEASTTPTTESVQRSVNEGAAKIDYYRNRMYENSLAWYTAEDKAFYEAENRRLAKEYEELTGNTLTPDSKSGYWYENGSSDPFYTLDRNEVGMAVVAAMKANSEAWKTADKSTQDKLAARNEELADRLAAFLKKPITKTAAGVWMLGNTPLYEVTKFHTGGIVGGRGSLRQNEVMALLKKGESVLDERREEALYKTVDFVQMLSDKIGHVIDKGRLSSLLAGTGASFPRGALPALAGGGIGTMNFAPTIQVTITGAGDLTESAARKYGNIAAESALAQLKSAFSQRGVSAPGNSILK